LPAFSAGREQLCCGRFNRKQLAAIVSTISQFRAKKARFGRFKAKKASNWGELEAEQQ